LLTVLYAESKRLSIYWCFLILSGSEVSLLILISVCRKTQERDKKYSNSRITQPEECWVTSVNDHFERLRNAEVGLYRQTLICNQLAEIFDSYFIKELAVYLIFNK